MRVALHIHTNASACSESRPEDIAAYCRAHNIGALGITDHNSIEGARRLRTIAPDLHVIVGEEVSTRGGEVIGLFLQETLPPGQRLYDTCREIKRQGGLVYVPHPSDKLKVHRIRRRQLLAVIDLVDIIEVFNAKSSLSLYNLRAAQLARTFRKAAAVGSDAHYVTSVGSALNIMEPFHGPADFLDKLSRAGFETHASSLLATWWVRVRKLLRSA